MVFPKGVKQYVHKHLKNNKGSSHHTTLAGIWTKYLEGSDNDCPGQGRPNDNFYARPHGWLITIVQGKGLI